MQPLEVLQKPSPFCDRRKRGAVIDTIVLHSIFARGSKDELGVESCVRLLKRHKVSAHYLIGRKGEVAQLVPEKKRAWHAGVSQMPDGREGANHFSIGIELIGRPTQPFTRRQYKALGLLVLEILSRHKVKFIVGHDMIALPPGRKTDPGKLFDWKLFSKTITIP